MGPIEHRKVYFDSLKKFLEVQIKLDIAETIRHDPHLAGPASARAYQQLASNESVEDLIKEMARAECEEAIKRGDLPPAAMIHLAGYRKNDIPTG